MADLRDYLDAGFPLVWNGARRASPAVAATCAGLAAAFGARVWANVYATGPAATPLDVHFDPHEVLAVQCAGTKTWRISSVRADRPLDVAEMDRSVAEALTAGRAAAASSVLLACTAEPGDVVYVPRGQFHQAWAEGRPFAARDLRHPSGGRLRRGPHPGRPRTGRPAVPRLLSAARG